MHGLGAGGSLGVELAVPAHMGCRSQDWAQHVSDNNPAPPLPSWELGAPQYPQYPPRCHQCLLTLKSWVTLPSIHLKPGLGEEEHQWELKALGVPPPTLIYSTIRVRS